MPSPLEIDLVLGVILVNGGLRFEIVDLGGRQIDRVLVSHRVTRRCLVWCFTSVPSAAAAGCVTIAAFPCRLPGVPHGEQTSNEGVVYHSA